MQQLRHTRFATWTLTVVLLCMSVWIQAYISQFGNGAFAQDAPNDVRGWYGIEQSDSIPTARGPIATQYQWTYNTARINIWPVPAGMRLLSLTYHNPLGDVRIAQNQQYIATLPYSDYVRDAHVLLPSRPQFQLTFTQSTPQVVDDRILGFIVLRHTWQAFNTPALILFPQHLNLILGLPLTIIALCALCLCAQVHHRYQVYATLVVMLGTIAVAGWSPWHSSAIQPLLQFILLAGCSGFAMHWVIRRTPQAGAVSLLLGLWGISSIFLFTPDIQGDGVGYYAYLRSLFVDGDLYFANEFSRTTAPFAFLPSYPIYPPTGYTINPWSIGPALLQVPFWLVAHGVVHVTQFLGQSYWYADGYSAPYVTMIGLSSVVAGLVTLFGMYHLLRRRFAQSVAVYSTALVYVASNLLYYAQINNNNVHSISTATVTLMLVAFMAIQDRATGVRWAIFGLIVGLIGIVYWVTLILCLFPAGVVLVQTRQLWHTRRYAEIKQLWLGVGIAAIVAVAVLALQSGVWYVMYDSLFTVPQGKAFAIPQYPRLWQMFFGDWYGLMWWTPALFIGIVGLFFYAKSAPHYGIWMGVAVWAYILYNASIPNWDGSSGFGFRRLSSIAPFVAFGVAYLVERTTRYRQLHVMLLGMLGAWTTRFALRYVEFRIVRSSWTFVDNLVVATFDPAILNMNTLWTVARPTWLGILWNGATVAHLIVALLVCSCMVGCGYVWYHPIAPQWWGISDIPSQNEKEQINDTHITA